MLTITYMKCWNPNQSTLAELLANLIPLVDKNPPVPANQLPPPVNSQQAWGGQQVYQGVTGPGTNFGYGQQQQQQYGQQQYGQYNQYGAYNPM